MEEPERLVVRPMRTGQPCPFGCQDGHEYKPLLNHFLRIHLAFSSQEMIGDGSRIKCNHCHLKVRKAIIDVHNTLQHGIALPDQLQRRARAVADGTWELRADASPERKPQIDPEIIAGDFRDYWDTDYEEYTDEGEEEVEEECSSPEADDDPALAMQASETLDAERELIALDEENGEKWALAREFLLDYRSWKQQSTGGNILAPNTWTAKLPEHICPRDTDELQNWSLAWNLDQETSRGTYVHFLVHPSYIWAVLSTHPAAFTSIFEPPQE